MRRYLRLMEAFARASAQEELAYRANFAIGLLYSALNLATGVASLWIVFGQVEQLHGWDFTSALALLGVYLALSALNHLVIGASLDALAGLGGDIWTGRFDFTLIRPANIQFLVSFRRWRLMALVDLALGLGVLVAAIARVGAALTAARLASFALMLAASALMFYAVLLFLASLVFWSPGFLFTWLFNNLWQLARWPLGFYPGWLRLMLTWVIPIGLMTTLPTQALMGALRPGVMLAAGGLAAALTWVASVLFTWGLRRYASASS